MIICFFYSLISQFNLYLTIYKSSHNIKHYLYFSKNNQKILWLRKSSHSLQTSISVDNSTREAETKLHGLSSVSLFDYFQVVPYSIGQSPSSRNQLNKETATSRKCQFQAADGFDFWSVHTYSNLFRFSF